jgi:hypothetical protein
MGKYLLWLRQSRVERVATSNALADHAAKYWRTAQCNDGPDGSEMLYNGGMSTQARSDALRAALHYLAASDTPAQHKKLLIEVVVQAMRADEAAARYAALQETDTEWQPHEAKAVEVFLQGRVARNWQHADEILMRLATQLHRKPANVRKKATEMGFGAGVDYRLAQGHAVTEGQLK